MAAPLQLTLIQTINRIYRFLGLDDSIEDTRLIFRDPRISRANPEKCDLCFPLISHGNSQASIPAVVLFPNFSKLKITFNANKVQQELPIISKTWTLPIKSCSTSSNSLCILLDRGKAFQNTITELLTFSSSSKAVNYQSHVVITIDEQLLQEDLKDLTQLRTVLAFQSLCKVFSLLGFSVETKPNISCNASIETTKYHVCYKSSCCESSAGFTLIYCGAVLDSSTGIKATSLDAKDYYRKKQLAFEKLAKTRENTADNISQSISLSEAEVSAELLCVRLRDHVSVNVSKDPNDIGARFATFLLYNHVRLSCIRKKFEEEVKSGIYQSLPDLKEVDFCLLTQEEEWELLLLVLQFPHCLVNCVSLKDKISLHPVLLGIDKICRTFSIYYRRVRVLTEPRPHLLPVMYARLYLLQCVEYIIGVGLSVFDMKTLHHM